jgi:LytS/YehU family sensor histidine kinase
MLRLYLELEEMRFEKKFSYSIKPDENINPEKIFIPGMIIQPFVENSVKHGVRNKTGDGFIEIYFSLNRFALICTVTDNGMGRKEAGKTKLTEHKSTGTSIVEDRIETLNTLSEIKMKTTTEDVLDENGNVAGTKVILEIPFKEVLSI